MKNLISTVVNQAKSLLNSLQLKQFVSVVLLGFLLLTSPITTGRNTQAVERKLDQVIHEDGAERPKTTREWQQEAREVEGEPGERAKRIGQQSVDAVKDFGALYPDTAKRSAAELEDSSNRD